MKYHSSILAIFISCVVLVVFLAAAAATVLFLTDNSPTLFIANEILDSLEEADSSVSFSFSSIDRNFRDGLYLNDVKAEGENFSVSFEKLSLHMGILSLLQFAVTGNGTLVAETEGTRVEIALSSGGEKNENEEKEPFSLDSLSVPSIFSRYNVALHAHDLELVVKDLLTLQDGEIDVVIADRLSASGRASGASVDYNGISVTLDGIAFDFIDQLRVLVDKVGLCYGESALSLDALRADLSLDGVLAFSFSGLEGNYEDAGFALGSASARLQASMISAELNGISVSKDECSAGLSTLLFYLHDLDSFTLFAYDLEAEGKGAELLRTDLLRLNGSIKEMRATAYSPSLSTGAAGLFTGVVSETELVSPYISASYDGDVLDLSFLTGFQVESGFETLHGASALVNLSASLSFKDGLSVKRFSASVSDGQLPSLSAPFDIDAYYEEKNADLYISLGSSLLVSGMLNEDSAELSMEMNDFRIGELGDIVDIFLPVFSNWVSEETSVSGSLGLQMRNRDGALEGPMNLALAVSDAKFNTFSFSFGTAFSAYLDKEKLAVSNASVTTSFARAVLYGAFDLERRLPWGRLMVSMTESGRDIFGFELILPESDEYSFIAWLPAFEDSWYRGSVDFSEDGLLTSSSELKIAYTTYPLDLVIDFSDQYVSLSSDSVDFRLDYSTGKVGFDLLVNSFALPAMPDVEPCVLDFSISSLIDFQDQSFWVEMPDTRVYNMRHLPLAPDLSFSFFGTDEHMRMENIVIACEGIETLYGALDLDITGAVYTCYLATREREPEQFMVSVHKMDDYYSGLLRLVNYDFTRFGLDGYIADTNLTVRGSRLSDLAFAGSLNASHIDGVRSISSDVYFDLSTIRLTDSRFNGTSVGFELPLIELDTRKGLFSLSASASYVKENKDRDYPMSAAFSLSLDTGVRGTLMDFASAVMDGGVEDFKAELSLESVNIDDNYFVGRTSSALNFTTSAVFFSGDFLDGWYDWSDGSFDIALDMLPLVRTKLDGQIGGDQPFDFHADIEAFDISLANLFLKKPYVHLYEGTMVHGDIHLAKDGDEWDLYGQAEAETAEMEVFWIPGAKVVLHNPTFMAWDNLVISNICDATVVDLTSYEKQPGKIDMSMQFTPSFGFDYFEVNITIGQGNEIGVRLPVIASNIDIWSQVSGELTFRFQDNKAYLSGDVQAKNGRLSIGMEPLPAWWIPSGRKTIIDLSILLLENVSIVLPLGSDPILTAYAAENQWLRVQIGDDRKLVLSGGITLRSGEVYYINKSFYITEGSVEFQNPEYTRSSINPLINLRARLRDFDTNGEKVDVYIVLKDATLENMVPYFESSPAKSTDEIMEILGLAMLPTGVYGDFSWGNLLSWVGVGWDVLNHVGIFNNLSFMPSTTDSYSFEDTVREALRLDTFSLHTKVVTNVLWDTVSNVLSTTSENLSPMARYMDGTSLYFGKYLNRSLYLEGMVHLTAVDTQSDRRHTFISDDLNLDVELSLEWDMPIATVKFFTQPDNMTFYSLLDAFGFTVTKRLVW